MDLWRVAFHLELPRSRVRFYLLDAGSLESHIVNNNGQDSGLGFCQTYFHTRRQPIMAELLNIHKVAPGIFIHRFRASCGLCWFQPSALVPGCRWWTSVYYT